MLCPFFENSKRYPKTPFLLHKTPITYQEVERLIQKATKTLSVYPSSLLAFVPQDPLETTLFLFATLRLQKKAILLNRFLSREAIVKKIDSIPGALWIEKLDLNQGLLSCHTLEPKAPWIFLETSGSSGSPKLCVHSYENFYLHAIASHQHLPFSYGDLWFLSLPLYHVSGLSLLFRALLTGASLYQGSFSHEIFSEKKITHLSLVPTQLIKLMQEPFPHSLKAVLIGGAPCPHSLLQEASWLPLFPTYGLTETASQVATGSLQDPFKMTPLSCHKVKINEGEICIKSSTLFLGYWEEGHIKPPTEWFPTGDLGEMKGEELLVLGRKDNLFISGGENIQPEAIEKVLLSYPGITSACVVPQQDSFWGERPVAFIKKEGPLDKTALIEFLGKYLEKYKIPLAFYENPFESLKPPRGQLKALLLEELLSL